MDTNLEMKRERFVRLAEKRTNEIIKRLKILGNCSNRHNYTYTAEDVEKIFAAIDKKLKETKLRFSSPEKETFKL